MKPILKMLLSLGGLTILAGGILAGVHALTAEPIARAAEEARIAAFAEVLPPFDNNPTSDAHTVGTATVYPATEGGLPVGAAVEIVAEQGFGGPFTLIVGFAADGAVSGYKVLSHAETPGLGAKMDSWFCDPTVTSRSVIGRNTPELKVNKDGGEIDAITGATITSRAFLDAVNRARQAYMESTQL